MSNILKGLNESLSTLSPEQVEQFKKQLEIAKQGFDPNYQYSDDYSFWKKQNDKAQTISRLTKILNTAGVELQEEGVAEGSEPEQTELAKKIRELLAAGKDREANHLRRKLNNLKDLDNIRQKNKQGVAEGLGTTPKITFAQQTPGSWTRIDILVNGDVKFQAVKTMGPGHWTIHDQDGEVIGDGGNKTELKASVLDYLSKQGVAEESDKQFAQRMKKKAAQPPTKGMSQKEKEDKGWAKPKEQGVAEAVWDRHSQSHIPRDGRTFGQNNHPREEHCDSCGAPTGHAGPGEDSNVDDNGNVYCDDCYADEQGVAEGQLDELSPQTLASYKKKAGSDATAADKRGDYKRGDKRMSGIIKATKKEFDNDSKGVKEGYRYDSGDYSNARMGREYGKKNLSVDSGAYEFEKEVHRNEPGGEHGRPKSLKGVSKSLPADAFGRTTGEIPAGKKGRVHSMMRDPDDELDEACWKGYHKEGNKKMFGKTYPNCVKNEDVAEEEQHSCPHCGSELVSEELMNEKKDACYYKVKSRYKVWPSAYASGALVKCRKSHGNWGNGGKKNESSILEGIERADENLHQWFKEKWVRFGPDGKIRGACARGDDSEGKPKCLPQAKAHSLGKKGRASAAARKRREDPNPDRSGPAINVNTKKKSNESVLDEKWSQKYKDSINCSNPKGFSQKAHCAGKKK